MTIVSCNDARKSETFRLLEDVDSYIEARPDCALAVLEDIDVEDLESREEKAKYALLMSMALDKNYIDRTDFEVLQPAIDYYEDHGTATDKLRTFYYQGRIYQNGRESEEAMECFIKSINLGDESNDISTKARNYNAQGFLYSQYYNWEKYVQCNLEAAHYYKLLNNIDAYTRMLCKASEGYIFLGEKDAADELLLECNSYLNQISDSNKAWYYEVYLTHRFENITKEDAYHMIDEYLNLVPQSDVDWLTIANVYLSLV